MCAKQCSGAEYRAADSSPPDWKRRWHVIVKWKLPSYLRQDQVRVFFSVITNPRDKALFTTIYLYGLRVSEACLVPARGRRPRAREDPDLAREERLLGRKAAVTKARADSQAVSPDQNGRQRGSLRRQTGPALEALGIETSSRASSTLACQTGGEARPSAGSSGPERSHCRRE